MATKHNFSVAFRKSDEYGVVAGSGWVILHNGKRLDWPMLSSRDEAEADLIDFIREGWSLAADEASEARGLAMMNGEME